MKKLSFIAWLAFYFVVVYSLAHFADSYNTALQTYYDAKHSQVARVLYGER